MQHFHAESPKNGKKTHCSLKCDLKNIFPYTGITSYYLNIYVVLLFDKCFRLNIRIVDSKAFNLNVCGTF